MPSRNSRKRQHKSSRPNKIVVSTFIIAFAIIAGLGGVLLLTPSSDSASSGAGSPTSPVLPAPRPNTQEVAADASKQTPENGAQGQGPTIDTGTKPGMLATDFTLSTLDGSDASLSDFRGQVVLVNFWASWCGPCRIEFPAIKSVYEKHKDEGFTVVAVNLGEQRDTAAAFAEQFELPFTVMLDTNAGVARIYGAYSIPTSYFLDRQGVIREMRVGAMPEAFIEQIVAQLLDES